MPKYGIRSGSVFLDTDCSVATVVMESARDVKRGQMLEAKAEAKARHLRSRSRPRPSLTGRVRGQS